MPGISMDTIVEKGKKKKLFLVVSNGTIHREFLKSFYELSTNSKNKFELIMHLCTEDETYMDLLEQFQENGFADVIMFMKPSTGFTCECIIDLFEKTLDSEKIFGICSPTDKIDFSKINEKNYKSSEILTKNYEINFMSKNIFIDEKTLMRVRGFKLTDIVSISLKLSRKGSKPINISRGFLNMESECYLVTKHRISNNGISGCLLEYFHHIQNTNK